MLNLFRENAQGIIMWIIIGIIILAMAGFVLPSYFSGGSGNILASINGIQISPRDLNQAVQQRKDTLRQQLGEYYNPDLISDEMLRQQELQRLVNRELFTQMVADQNLEVGHKQIMAQLDSYKEFKDSAGNFSARLYKRMLKAQGMSQAGFELNLAKDVATKNFFDGVFNTIIVTPKQAATLNELQAQQREAMLLRFDFAKYPLEKNIDDATVQEYYDRNKNLYMTEAKVSVEYVDLNLESVAAKQVVEYTEISEYYEQNLQNYTELDYPTALKIATDMKYRSDKGEDFAELAKKYSRDASSASKGGELAFYARGIYGKEFDDAVSKLKQGEVSQPVKSNVGYHVIKLLELDGDKRKVAHIQIKAPPKVKNLAEVSEQIKKEIQLRKAEETFYDDVDKLQNTAYEIQDSLIPTAEAIGVKIQSTDKFTRTKAEGVFKNPVVMNAVFKAEVLNEGKNSEVIQLSDTHYVVLRVKEYNEPAQKSLADVKDSIISAIAQENRNKKANADVQAAIAELKAGKNIVDVVKLHKYAALQSLGFISRATGTTDKRKDDVPNSVRTKLFTMPIPAAKDSKPTVDTVRLEDGDEGVIIFSAVRQDPAFKADDSAKQRLARRQLDNIYGNAEFSGFEKLLFNQADVVMNVEQQEEQ